MTMAMRGFTRNFHGVFGLLNCHTKQLFLRRSIGSTTDTGTDSSSQQLRQVIKQYTELTRNHLTPEIKLHLITPSCSLWNTPSDQSLFPDPFWAFYWPGGQALTRYLLDNASIVQGKEVLDVGSGCGASSIAAIMMGAKTAIANDICTVAATAMKLNAEANGVEFSINTNNLIGSVSPSWDVVLLGDMFYDAKFTDRISKWAQLLDSEGKTILIGDPGRMYFKEHSIKKRLKCVYETELPQDSKGENNGLTHGYVWQYVGTS